ncbi:MAG: hypothetical protein IJI16_02965, partial [Atopobiaceae bacterium]|nr:hypothetical protein [Atopobiaceae bacterium]
MQKFIATESFWNLVPDAQIGIVVVRDMKTADEVTPEDAAEVEALLKKANVQASRHITNPTLSQNQPVAVWRAAYQKFKTKKGARVSIENLLKRVMKDNPVGHITPSVDIYNAISLKWAFPVGGENVDS